MGLDDATILALLKAPEDWYDKKKSNKAPLSSDAYKAPPQKGPVRFYDRARPCASRTDVTSRGCGSSTHIVVEGKPLCMMHAIRALNELVIELQNSPRTLIGEYNAGQPIL